MVLPVWHGSLEHHVIPIDPRIVAFLLLWGLKIFYLLANAGFESAICTYYVVENCSQYSVGASYHPQWQGWRRFWLPVWFAGVVHR